MSIDGYSQPGARPNTKAVGNDALLKIELDGINGPLDGLVIKGSNISVQGLAINDFASSGVSIEGGFGARIEGNFIGTDLGGDFDKGNRSAGVDIDGSFGSGANTVGGDEPAERNVISGNDSEGIFVFNGSSNNQVFGNFIGTKKDGITALGNGTHGVDIKSGANVVGGSTSAFANTIAFNGGDGVRIGFGGKNTITGNRVLSNSIFSNKGLGIDLNADGPTANDAGDVDSGPNTLRNKPVLSFAKVNKEGAIIKGTLNSTPNKTFNVQFFSNP